MKEHAFQHTSTPFGAVCTDGSPLAMKRLFSLTPLFFSLCLDFIERDVQDFWRGWEVQTTFSLS